MHRGLTGRGWMTGAALGAMIAAGAVGAQQLGEPVPEMTVVYYASDMGPEFEQSARALADDWAKLGLDLQLVPVQFSTFVSQYIVGGQLEDMAVFSVGADPDRVDPTYWVYDVAACGLRRNGSKWCDEGYSERAAKQRTLVDRAERVEAVHALQAEFTEAMPFFPVINRIYGIVYNSDKWENVTSPEPVAAHEEMVNPWLKARPLTDDRWLDWAYFEDVSTYNPLVEESAVGWVRFIFDTFAKNNSEGETVPWAAAGWTWVDDTTLEVTLRDGMTFHDGEAVTADDAVYTINTVVDLAPPAVSSRTSNITSAEKIDDLTFRINLKAPDAAFEITVLTYMFILPEHIWSAHDGDLLEWDIVADDAVIGSGPFQFQTWRPNEVHELATYAEHWEAPEYDGLRRLALGPGRCHPLCDAGRHRRYRHDGSAGCDDVRSGRAERQSRVHRSAVPRDALRLDEQRESALRRSGLPPRRAHGQRQEPGHDRGLAGLRHPRLGRAGPACPRPVVQRRDRAGRLRCRGRARRPGGSRLRLGLLGQAAPARQLSPFAQERPPVRGPLVSPRPPQP
ncbi:ABC transporter substrate-binding protein [Ponticoccus litoralis]|uniref:ABC transporter substrate-binding protein n=1 Tax=Ponticoccus litoralis TaxID=422297 RepID=A0AAW9SKZ0_9RHOB